MQFNIHKYSLFLTLLIAIVQKANSQNVVVDRNVWKFQSNNVTTIKRCCFHENKAEDTMTYLRYTDKGILSRAEYVGDITTDCTIPDRPFSDYFVYENTLDKMGKLISSVEYQYSGGKKDTSFSVVCRSGRLNRIFYFYYAPDGLTDKIVTKQIPPPLRRWEDTLIRVQRFYYSNGMLTYYSDSLYPDMKKYRPSIEDTSKNMIITIMSNPNSEEYHYHILRPTRNESMISREITRSRDTLILLSTGRVNIDNRNVSGKLKQIKGVAIFNNFPDSRIKLFLKGNHIYLLQPEGISLQAVLTQIRYSSKGVIKKEISIYPLERNTTNKMVDIKRKANKAKGKKTLIMVETINYT